MNAAMSNYLIGLQVLQSEMFFIFHYISKTKPEKLSHIYFQLKQMTNYIKSNKSSFLYKNPQVFLQFMFDPRNIHPRMFSM